MSCVFSGLHDRLLRASVCTKVTNDSEETNLRMHNEYYISILSSDTCHCFRNGSRCHRIISSLDSPPLCNLCPPHGPCQICKFPACRPVRDGVVSHSLDLHVNTWDICSQNDTCHGVAPDCVPFHSNDPELLCVCHAEPLPLN